MAYAWSIGNSPKRVARASDWLAAFEAVGYVSDEESPEEAPDVEHALYRDATSDRRLGLAWTERLAVAVHFADDLRDRGEDGHVYRAHVEPWRVKDGSTRATNANGLSTPPPRRPSSTVRE